MEQYSCVPYFILPASDHLFHLSFCTCISTSKWTDNAAKIEIGFVSSSNRSNSVSHCDIILLRIGSIGNGTAYVTHFPISPSPFLSIFRSPHSSFSFSYEHVYVTYTCVENTTKGIDAEERRPISVRPFFRNAQKTAQTRESLDVLKRREKEKNGTRGEGKGE